jgi:hypothetical protein
MAQYKGWTREYNDLQMNNLKMDFNLAFSNRIVEFEFVKADGTERKMKATTNPTIIATLIGPKDATDEKKERKVNEYVCKVFDVEAKAWRSFRWDSVITYSSDDYGY